MARDVFISYQSSDKECADRVCETLERQNISCWIAPRDIAVGAEWAAAIVEGLQRCHSFVVILSSHSLNARQISREAELADNGKLPIFTLRIEDVQPPPGLLYFLGNVQWLDAFGGQFEASLARLATVIRQSQQYPAATTRIQSSQPVATGSAAAAAPNPSAVEAFRVPAANPSPAPAEARKNSVSLIAVAIAVLGVAIALGAWLFTRHPQRPQRHVARVAVEGRAGNESADSEAKAVAERFLKYRDAGDFDAAWKEFTPENQSRIPEPRWTRNQTEWTKRYGEAKTQTVESCQLNPANGIYDCQVSIVYANHLSSQDRIAVARAPDGRWGIASAARTIPK